MKVKKISNLKLSKHKRMNEELCKHILIHRENNLQIPLNYTTLFLPLKEIRVSFFKTTSALSTTSTSPIAPIHALPTLEFCGASTDTIEIEEVAPQRDTIKTKKTSQVSLTNENEIQV